MSELIVYLQNSKKCDLRCYDVVLIVERRLRNSAYRLEF